MNNTIFWILSLIFGAGIVFFVYQNFWGFEPTPPITDESGRIYSTPENALRNVPGDVSDYIY